MGWIFKMPEWVAQPVNRFGDYVQSERELLVLATNGIQAHISAAEMAKVLHRVGPLIDTPPTKSRAMMRSANRMARMARKEVEADFPLLFAHSLVGVWGALEAVVHDLALAWLTHRPKLLRRDELESVKVPLASFHRMTRVERMEYLLSQVPARPGAGGGFPRLESLLDLARLSGPVPEEMRKYLIEAYEARNVSVHRGGVVDAKALTVCPWQTDWVPGAPLAVSRDTYSQYASAIGEYVVLLVHRSTARLYPQSDQAQTVFSDPSMWTSAAVAERYHDTPERLRSARRRS